MIRITFFIDKGDIHFRDPTRSDRSMIQGILYDFISGCTDSGPIHDDDGAKSFSISPFLQTPEGYKIVIGCADDGLQNRVLNHSMDVTDFFHGQTTFLVDRIDIESCSYEAEFKDSGDTRRLKICDAVFKRNNRYFVYPTPDIIFGSLYNKIRRLTKFNIPCAVDDLVNNIEPVRYEASTNSVSYKGHSIPCFNADITFKCRDPELRPIFHGLITMAHYTGLGSYTTRGNGYVESPPEGSKCLIMQREVKNVRYTRQ